MAKTPTGANGDTQTNPPVKDTQTPPARAQGSPVSNGILPNPAHAREERADEVRPRRRGARRRREAEVLGTERTFRDSADARAEPAPRRVPVNAIRPTRQRLRAAAPLLLRDQAPAETRAEVDARARSRASTPGASAPEAEDPERRVDRHTMPEEIKQRFVQVGNKYHFPDGARAFTDHGNRLTSPSENSEVIKSLVSIAQARGWSDITVTGTERFRKEAWFAARLAGLEVRGYSPNKFEHGRLVRALARSQVPSAQTPPPSGPRNSPASPVEAMAAESRRDVASRAEAHAEPRARPRALQVGRLVDHGAAPYLHDPHNAMSYFVRIETVDGEREIWGVDLHRALKESLTRPQIGDEVGVRALRREPVKVLRPEHDAEGRMIGEKEITAHRNAWIVEKRDFFRERALASRVLRDASVDRQKAVKQHPELLGTYLQLHAAELAAKAIRDPADQRRFVESVRNALADDVARGVPLPPVRLKDTPAQRRERYPPNSPTVAERDIALAR